uniref:Calbindin n=1 Tax=Sinocyclocheilus grahami TaxID=75366 RepID=A0A672Q376_SINGR
MANAYLQGVEISASQFLDIFHHYDSDGNGYIEGKELQNFIRELQQARKQAGLELTDKMKAFVEKYEQNADGKIGIIELVQILPTEENFLLFFRQQLKSCAEFMEVSLKCSQFKQTRIDNTTALHVFEVYNYSDYSTKSAWRNYDADHSGYIEADELKVRNNLLTFQKIKIPTYKSAIMALSDGGKLYRTELALVLCAEEM